MLLTTRSSPLISAECYDYKRCCLLKATMATVMGLDCALVPSKVAFFWLKVCFSQSNCFPGSKLYIPLALPHVTVCEVAVMSVYLWAPACVFLCLNCVPERLDSFRRSDCMCLMHICVVQSTDKLRCTPGASARLFSIQPNVAVKVASFEYTLRSFIRPLETEFDSSLIQSPHVSPAHFLCRFRFECKSSCNSGLYPVLPAYQTMTIWFGLI